MPLIIVEMQAVVTGAAGFIGGHLVDTLRREGHHVLGIDRRRGFAVDVLVDIADRASLGLLGELVALADAVFHLAARPGVRDAAPDLAYRRARDNVLTAQHVLAVTPRDAHVLVASSSAVYGGARSTVGGLRASSEDDPIQPRGGYARSKAEVERLCAEHRRRGALVTVVRPFTVGGEGQRPDMAIARFIAAARADRPIQLIGSPRTRRDITDVRDVVRGAIRVVETSYVGTLNLGTGIAHTLAGILGAVVAAVGHPVEVVRVPGHADDVAATLADTSRCGEVLGFVPRSDLHSLIARQLAATPAVQERGQVAR